MPLLFLVQLLTLIMWICQFQWIFTVNMDDSNNTEYCENKYVRGFHDYKCTGSLLQGCDTDTKCIVHHRIFGENQGFFCKYDSDCNNCRCDTSNVIKSALTALYVFFVIGVLLEAVKSFHILINLNNNFIDIDNKSFQWSQDSFLFLLIKLFNPDLWNQLMIEYQNKKFFQANFYWGIEVIFYQIPSHIIVINIINSMDNKKSKQQRLVNTLIISIICIVARFGLKGIYKYWSSWSESSQTSHITKQNNPVTTINPPPTTYPQPILNVHPQPIIQPQPIPQPQQIVHPQQMTYSQPIVHPQQIIHPQPIIKPQPIVQPQQILHPQQMPHPQQMVYSQPPINPNMNIPQNNVPQLVTIQLPNGQTSLGQVMNNNNASQIMNAPEMDDDTDDENEGQQVTNQ